MIADKKELTKWIIIAIVVLIIFYEIKSALSGNKDSELAKEKQLDNMKINKMNLTYKDPNVYLELANHIDEALGYFVLPGQSENMVTAFDMIKNLDDLKSVILAYGTRGGNLLGENMRKFLGKWTLLGYATLSDINDILKKNKVVNYNYF